MNSVKKDEELIAPNWSDFFSEHGISTRWPFHQMDLFPAVNIKYTKKEFESKSFSQTFNLPENVDPDKIEATYQEEILQLIIPKKEKRKPTLKKKITLS